MGVEMEQQHVNFMVQRLLNEFKLYIFMRPRNSLQFWNMKSASLNVWPQMAG